MAVTNFNNPASLALAAPGTSLYKTVWTNIAPRIGAAFTFGDRTGWATVLRGGFGFFFDVQNPLLGYILGSASGSANTLYTNNPIYPLMTDQLMPPVISINPPFLNFQAIDPRLKTPRTYQWNGTLEQQLGHNFSLSTGYVAAVGHALIRLKDLANINSSFTGLTNFGSNYGYSNYKALQTQLNGRVGERIRVLASYTWSHSIDNGSAYPYGGVSGFGVPTVNYNPDSDKASSDFDSRHTFTFSSRYEIGRHGSNGLVRALASGWFVDPIFRAQSARPVNPYIFVLLQGLQVNPRPDLVASVPFYIADPNVAGGRRLNPAAFDNFLTTTTPVSAARQGTLPRNVLRGFPTYQLDLAIARQFLLTERLRLNFRSEFFNLTNHANFDLYNPTVNTPSFGTVQATANNATGFTTQVPVFAQGGPRSVQMSLRLVFYICC